MISWTVGDLLTHRFNPELGIGRVTAVEGRTMVVEFPTADKTLRLAVSSDALTRALSPDAIAGGEGSLFDRLAKGAVDDPKDFLIRLDMLRLLAVREAQGLGSFLGGRVRIFPHQLYVAERATRTSPVRWLLADEVGLGKTIEACLILNHLVHTGGPAGDVERCLIVAPEALTVQWLGELWRKYHQVFTLLDSARLADVARDFGPDFNPFDAHRRVVIALETLVAQPQLTEQAVKAGIDLLVVDEAQHLRRPPGHPGDPAYRAVAPIAALGRHALLLSATPLEDDAHGFMRLLQLLRPAEFPDGAFAGSKEQDPAHVSKGQDPAYVREGHALPPCTSATKRTDIGGLPPRVGVPIALDENKGWKAREQVEAEARQAPASNVLERKRKIERIKRAAFDITPEDPRIEWLVAQAPKWKAAGDKTLVFVSQRETLDALRTALSHRVQLATGMFHEELSTIRRDTEVARFREAEGPSLLVSTESGGEGRNFEFCQRVILFDLPWKPSTVEQRIGRLDRIGRRIPVEIVYFTPPRGIGAAVVRLFERIGLFKEPLAGFEPQLAQIEGALEQVALDPDASLSDTQIDELLSAAFAARSRIQEAAYQQLHREPYRADMADAILARVPQELDELMERVVTRGCLRLGFRVDHLRNYSTYAIEFGNEALVDSLPGVPGDWTFIGTFDREEAVADDTIDFFASGHPLVEGILTHYQDGGQGRVARLEVEVGNETGEGILVVYKEGSRIEVRAIDADGRPRREWAAAAMESARGLAVLTPAKASASAPAAPRRIMAKAGLAAPQPVAKAGEEAAMVRRLIALLEPDRQPEAIATLVIRPFNRTA